MPDEVAFILKIGVEVFVWVRPGIVLLEELLGDKELGAPFAFEKLLLLLGRQLQQVFVGSECLLLELELLLLVMFLDADAADSGSDVGDEEFNGDNDAQW